MSIRPYRNETDFDAVRRLWEEIAWLDRDEDDHVEGLKHFLGSSENLVAEMNGEAECLVARCAGTIRHLDSDLSMCVIAAVTTSRPDPARARLDARVLEWMHEPEILMCRISPCSTWERSCWTRQK